MRIHHSAWKRSSKVKSWLLAPSDHLMEPLGAAAAISQFLVQFIATVDLAKRLKGSSQSLKRYQEQLEDLRDLCADISSNPALSTDEVRRETQSILHTIGTHKDVSSLLKKGRIHRSIAFILNERSFGEFFATLEKKKTNLTLRVQNINCLALHDLRLQVISMSRNTIPYGPLSPPLSPTPTMACQQPQNSHHGLRMPSAQASPCSQTGSTSHASRSTRQTAVYDRNEAGNNVHQHNGPVVYGRTMTATSQFSSIVPEYRGNIKHGVGDQINSMTYQPARGSGSVLDFVPVAPGRWTGNKHTGSADGQGESKQISGTLIIV